MFPLYPRLSGTAGCGEVVVYSGIIGPCHQIPPVNGLETKASFDFPGIARFIAARTDASGEIGIEEAAQSVVGPPRKARRVYQRCALPPQPKVSRLPARARPAGL